MKVFSTIKNRNRMKHIYIYLIVLLGLISSCEKSVNNPVISNEYPYIYPDYVNVTIPCNIAPLNFAAATPIDLIDVTIKGSKTVIHLQEDETIKIPIKKWKKLLTENIGDDLHVTVCFYTNKKWTRYKDFAIHISKDSIDYGLVYRLIAPGYEVYSKMGLYQRNLSNFDQTPIIENTLVPGCCVNCHAFRHNNPDRVSFHVRGANGATVLQQNGEGSERFIDTKTDKTLSSCVYPYWHPDGRYIAYSNNKTNQAFHAARNERIEVVDQASDVVVYDTKENKLLLCPRLMTDAFETFPAFSSDGSKLYFCSAAKKKIPSEYKEIKYSLCSIDFNAKSGTFGNKIDTIISARETKKSISFPRPSFDGKYIMFTMADYGNFSIWHREADLYLLNLKTGKYRAINEVNSNNTESFHDWSSNSHWFVFSSRRDDGLYTRLYIASINKNGSITKPFMLPQKDPMSNLYSLYSYNVPEFITTPVKIDMRRTGRKLLEKSRTKFDYKKVK
jgi:hypothetical protein